MHACKVAHDLSHARISYVTDNYEPLLATGRMRTATIAGPGITEELCPCIAVECYPGHTAQ